MKRRMIILVLLVGLTVFAAPLWAQDGEGPDEDFVPALLRHMKTEQVDAAELGALERYLHRHRFQEAAEGDPELVALALDYALKQQKSGQAEFMAQLAYQLALANHEMVKMGFEEREIVRAVMNGTRSIVQAKNQLQLDSGEDGEMIRLRLRQEIHNTEQTQLKTQTRQKTQTNETPGDGSPGPGPGKDKPGQS